MVFDPVKDAEYMRTSKMDKGLEVVLESLLDDKPENGPASFCSLMLQWAMGVGAFDKVGSLQGILRTVFDMLQVRNHTFSAEEKDLVRRIKGTLSPRQSVHAQGPWQQEGNNGLVMAKKVVRKMKLTNALAKQSSPTQGISVAPNAAKLLLDICLDISTQQVDHAKLITSLIQGASSLLQADRCTFFLVEGDELVSKIAEGTGEIRLPIGHGIAGTVAQTGTVINIDDAYSDPRFNQNVDRKTGYKTKNLICAPIFFEESVIAVAQLLNKQSGAFTTADVSLFEVFSSFAGVFLANSYHYHEVTREKRKNEILLDVVHRVNATDLSSWEEVAEVIRDGCKKLLHAERCTLYLLDKEAGLLSGSDGASTFRLPMNQGIAGFVCTSGETVNIPDAYCDPRFNPDIDANTGFVTKSILCMPIVTNKEIVAVAQVINKSNKGEFVEEDEELLQFFTAFSGLHLWNAKLLEFCKVSRESAMRLLTSQNGEQNTEDSKDVKDDYGITIASESAAAAALAVPVQAEELASVLTPDFNVHLYSLKSDGFPKIIRLIIHLFETMGYLSKYKISKEKMARFLLTIQSKYRAVPYHNFVHAFDVLQSVFVYLYCYNVKALLSESDSFTLLVTALIHDVDHMGLNNSFHSKSETPLGLLSSASGASSVLEVHHCNVAIAVLSIPEINIFSNLSKNETVQIYKVMIHNVLHTDMAKHAEILNAYQAITREEYHIEEASHRQLVCAILLKCADLSNLTKPFNISRLWAIAITTEFYLQGDSERAEGKAITPGFDRTTKQELAKAQLGFLNFVGLKFFSTVAQGILLEMEPVLVNLKSNAAKWEAILS